LLYDATGVLLALSPKKLVQHKGRYVTLMSMTQEIQIPLSKILAVATRDGILVPRVIAAAGDKAARRLAAASAAAQPFHTHLCANQWLFRNAQALVSAPATVER
jgi:hypothetical protein